MQRKQKKITLFVIHVANGWGVVYNRCCVMLTTKFGQVDVILRRSTVAGDKASDTWGVMNGGELSGG